MINALKVTGRKISDIRAVITAQARRGTAVVRLLLAMGLKEVILCDRTGAIWEVPRRHER
jgi:malate dehydrogenase (oxaloacetate-decarboxylating)